MDDKIDKLLILNRLKLYYKFKTSLQLAKHLNLKPTTLSNWYKRGSIDFGRIFTKCAELNPNWIVDGIGSPRRYQNLDDMTADIAIEPEIIYSKEKFLEEIDQLKKVISLQEQTIKAQEQTIEVLKSIK